MKQNPKLNMLTSCHPPSIFFFLITFFFPPLETSLSEYVIIQKHVVSPGCSINTVSKALKEVERAVIKMLLLLSYSGMYQTSNEIKCHEVISANELPN